MKKIKQFFRWLFGIKAKEVISLKPQDYPPYSIDSFDRDVYKYINNHREDNGLPHLKFHPILPFLAYSHCKYMAMKGKASHDNFEMRSRGFEGKKFGENVAYGYNSAASLVNAWSKSELHNINMCGDYNSMGVAHSGKYVTVEFLKEN